MKVNDSALRHGISPEDSVYAATWALWVEDLDDNSPARQLRLCFDTRSRLLEIVALLSDSGNELIIHSMRARPHMLDLLP